MNDIDAQLEALETLVTDIERLAQRGTLICLWCHDTTITVRPGEEPADAADREHWYDGSVCPSCALAARAADGADDWVSEGRP